MTDMAELNDAPPQTVLLMDAWPRVYLAESIPHHPTCLAGRETVRVLCAKQTSRLWAIRRLGTGSGWVAHLGRCLRDGRQGARLPSPRGWTWKEQKTTSSSTGLAETQARQPGYRGRRSGAVARLAAAVLALLAQTAWASGRLSRRRTRVPGGTVLTMP